jgi:hypothetical protein
LEKEENRLKIISAPFRNKAIIVITRHFLENSHYLLAKVPVRRRHGYLKVGSVPSFFGDPEKSRKNYCAFVEKGFDQRRKPELVGGGLIRSLGGWSEVLASRRRDEKQVVDRRILGDSDFVGQMISGLDLMVEFAGAIGSNAQICKGADSPAQAHPKDRWRPLSTVLLQPLQASPLQTGSIRGR